MGSRSISSFVNGVTKPVSALEFKDALDAACRPQFPTATWYRDRPLALAVSGGLDSMALTHLAVELSRTVPQFRVAGYPVTSVVGLIVDHGLREGSAEEAMKVAAAIRDIGAAPTIRTLKWGQLVRHGIVPADLSNVESMARKLRYWYLGKILRNLGAPVLLLGHHEDDQYETVLMRLLGGHSYRGLRGMQPMNDMPETHGLYGVHKSGLIADQQSTRPSVRFRPTQREQKRLRNIFREEHRKVPVDTSTRQPVGISAFHDNVYLGDDPRVPYLTPVHTEGGGKCVIRPLLGFSKDRLRATLEARGISWFEDHTNADQTLTMRNAVRHIVRNHTLPRALQKESILALSQKARRRVEHEEAEARRLLTRHGVAKNFDPCAGTLIIDLPSMRPKRRKKHDRLFGARAEARKPRQKLIAALALRQLIDFVTPETNLPPPSAMGNVVMRLFPELRPSSDPAPPRPTAFGIAGVLFEPIVRPDSVRWFLSRAPYTSKQNLPNFLYDWRIAGEAPPTPEQKAACPPAPPSPPRGWHSMKMRRLWDGRFWFSIDSTVKERFHVRPYDTTHARAFKRRLLPHQLARMEELLKHYAPGKVRTTLPALYLADHDAPMTRESVGNLTLIGLPTMRIQLPGTEEWVRCHCTYKKVDTTRGCMELPYDEHVKTDQSPTAEQA
ncbi:uncharacterized protein F5Z01DRAFT_680063 [Emericellopsis atlantica]|uniref:tRNA(Ile)-lysidine synthetase n=1 Tax=Emericellopsis atlantica TaxID=2614577 RepID=A0A9P8CRG1_9HYPO|nr:uncharacterized protein F5Z01DRAFT_680063 [Emericellopsis atlantica]KAG9256693.1 hypothetical protein F5Z01DRAFT_680063 [Emericellopsis atlantica]